MMECLLKNTINLNNNPRSSGNPRMEISGTNGFNNIYIGWDDRGGGIYDVSYKRSIDSGRSFENTMQINSNNNHDAINLGIAASRSDVYFIWRQGPPFSSDIFYRKSPDGGRTLGPIIDLSQNNGDSTLADIVASGNNVYVVWQDRTPGNYDIFYRRSTNNGDNFEDIINVSHNSGFSGASQVYASSSLFVFISMVDRVYVTWVDSGGVGGHEDIFYTWNSTTIPATGGSPLILPRGPSVAVYCNNFSFVVYERSFTHPTTFNVVDSKGNIVSMSKEPVPPNSSFRFDLSGYPPGTYTLNVYENVTKGIPRLVVSQSIHTPCLKDVKGEEYVPYWVLFPETEDIIDHEPSPENETTLKLKPQLSGNITSPSISPTISPSKNQSFATNETVTMSSINNLILPYITKN